MAAYTVDRNADYAVQKLQRQVDTYLDWADKWRIAVNASKSTAVVFMKRIEPPRQQLVVGRTYLPWANSVKYLGHHQDRLLTWRTHTDNVAEKFNFLDFTPSSNALT